MAWPATAVVTGDPVTTIQLNGLPVMIADSTLSADAASILFNSIPQHYAHLMIHVYGRGSTAAIGVILVARFNGDLGGNYDRQLLFGRAATVNAQELFAQTAGQLGGMPADTAGANLFASIVFTVPHYANALNNKVYSSRWAYKSGTSSAQMESGKHAGFWRSNAAITAVTLLPLTDNLRAGSRATLYGLA